MPLQPGDLPNAPLLDRAEGFRTACPACEDSRTDHSFSKADFSIWQCRKCGSMFVADPPDSGRLAAIYGSNVYYDLPTESIERIKHENARRLRLIARHGNYRTLLDVGCAKGLLLDAAKAMGFDTYGTELSRRNVELCLEHGHKVIQGYAQDMTDVPEGKFDVITCLDVIEHVDRPIDMLLTLTGMLADHGLLVVSTPNYSGTVARLLGERDPFLIPPEHLNFFTRKGMHLLFFRSHLSIQRFVTFGRLTREEQGRVVGKYFPARLRFLEPAIQSMLPIALEGLNLVRSGLEQEYYLSRRD